MQRLSMIGRSFDNRERWLGGFVVGAGLGYKSADHFFIRAEAGWFHSASSEVGFDISTPYMTLGIGWFFGMPSSSVEAAPSNPLQTAPL